MTMQRRARGRKRDEREEAEAFRALLENPSTSFAAAEARIRVRDRRDPRAAIAYAVAVAARMHGSEVGALPLRLRVETLRRRLAEIGVDGAAPASATIERALAACSAPRRGRPRKGDVGGHVEAMHALYRELGLQRTVTQEATREFLDKIGVLRAVRDAINSGG